MVKSRFKKGDIVVHFKRQLQDNPKKYDYMYRITGFGKDATTDKDIILYEPLYECEYHIFTRTISDFEAFVDRTKYPTVTQLYRFDKCEFLSEEDSDTSTEKAVMIPVDGDIRGYAYVFNCSKCHCSCHLGEPNKEYEYNYCPVCGFPVEDIPF